MFSYQLKKAPNPGGRYSAEWGLNLGQVGLHVECSHSTIILAGCLSFPEKCKQQSDKELRFVGLEQQQNVAEASSAGT